MLFKCKKATFVLIFGALFFIGSAIFISRVFSYNDTITHPSLTENIAKIYNKNSEVKLTSQEVEWLKQGSIEEDTPPRWLNHFYEPHSNKGWWIFLSSKEWAENSIVQSAYIKGNQTWQKAIDNYIKGDKKESFIALGHVLHLIEDVTVPAHTRLDAHPFGDPYENWVRDSIGYQIDFNIGMADVNQLSSAFDDLAFYSNNYFFSEDTLPDNIILAGKERFIKEIDGKLYKCIKGAEGQCLLLVKKDLFGNDIYFFDIPVHSDYFSLLAPKAVSYGAGVIKLFFEEAERQKQLEKQKSWWEKVKEFLFGSISSQLPIEPGQENAPAQPAQETNPKPEPSQTKIPSEPAQSSLKAIAPENPENPAETISNPQPPEGGGIQEKISKPEIPSEITEKKFKPFAPPQSTPESPVILAAAKNTENEEEPEESVSTSTPPSQPKISIYLSDYSITSRQFTVNWHSSSTDVLTFDVERKISSGNWQNWLASTTATSTLFEVPQDKTVYYFRARPTNNVGLSGDWQEVEAPIYFYPVVINEIAWAGTGTSTKARNDEWMELYNKSDYPVNLSGWLIVEGKDSTTTVVALQGQIDAHDYYLIERTDDKTISDIIADLAKSFGGSGLSNSGESLRLVDKQNQIIDIVDCSGGWLAGSAAPDYRTMERVNPYLAFDVPGNWQSNSTSTRNGSNIDGQPINGTPRAQNSAFNLEFFYLYPAEDTTATSTKLKWTPSYINNFKEYKIVRSFDAGFNAASTTIVAATTTTNFFDESLESETTYYYKLSACDLSDYCVSSNIASTTTSEFPFSWAEPQIISEFSTSTTVYMPDIILVSDGTPAIIWGSSTSTETRYVKFSKKSSDDTWSESINISQDLGGYEMQVLGKDNRLEVLHSAWGNKEGGGIYFDVFSVRSENGVWQPPQNISQEGTNNSWAAGTIDSAMTTHIVWQGLSQSSSSPFYSKAIFYRAVDSSGLFLGMPEEIPGSINGFSPNIIVDSQNKLYVFWSGCTPPYCDEIFYSINNLDGSGWSEGQMIFDGKFESTISGRPQILLDENNQFLLAWQQRSYEIAVTKFDGLASTTEKTIFSKANKQASTPSLIVNNFKKPYVFWSHGSDTGGGIYFSWQKQNGQWQEIKTALEKSQPIMWARAVIDLNNIAHLVWGNDHLEIYYTYGKIE